MAGLVLKGMNLHGPKQQTLFLPLEKQTNKKKSEMQLKGGGDSFIWILHSGTHGGGVID